VGTAFGCDSWDWRTIADDEFASTCKSEKSFEVSSMSLRNSVVSRVARLQNSNPTTTKRITLGRIFESDNTEELYSKWMFNSTAMQKRVDIIARDTRQHGSARTGKFSEGGWATRARLNPHASKTAGCGPPASGGQAPGNSMAPIWWCGRVRDPPAIRS
jgi:hypothetical protein